MARKHYHSGNGGFMQTGNPADEAASAETKRTENMEVPSIRKNNARNADFVRRIINRWIRRDIGAIRSWVWKELMGAMAIWWGVFVDLQIVLRNVWCWRNVSWINGLLIKKRRWARKEVSVDGRTCCPVALTLFSKQFSISHIFGESQRCHDIAGTLIYIVIGFHLLLLKKLPLLYAFWRLSLRLQAKTWIPPLVILLLILDDPHCSIICPPSW